jgi:hypothetical protein
MVAATGLPRRSVFVKRFTREMALWKGPDIAARTTRRLPLQREWDLTGMIFPWKLS